MLAGCSSAGSVATSTTTTAPPAGPGVPGVVDAATVGTLGRVLVDRAGDTLYRYGPDGFGAPRCTGACAVTWPPLTVAPGSRTTVAGPGVSAADVGTVTRADGSLQVTYDLRPLYTYSGDTAPGQANGEGKGGTWAVVPVAGGGGTSPKGRTTHVTGG
jgi:predicted lipoprotein with Yx(FWY)xxD motif